MLVGKQLNQWAGKMDDCEPKTVHTYLVSPQEFLGFDFFNYKCVLKLKRV